MLTHSIPASLIYGIFLGRRNCSAFTSTAIPVPVPPRTTAVVSGTTAAHRPNSRSCGHCHQQQHSFPISSLSTRTNAAAASTTSLHAKGFGPPPPTPNPSAYYVPDDDEDEAKARGPPSGREQQQPFPDVFADTSRKVEAPKGIGTLFSRADEVIRELSSEEYLDILRDWAPLASFVSSEVLDPEIKESAVKIRAVLRGMAEWQPRRNSDFTKAGSKWSFGAPVGAIKGGQVDALACLQVSEDEGVVIEWICGNPTTLGIPGNAVDWLAKGVYTLCGRRLDLPVTIASEAMGEGGDSDSGKSMKRKDGSSGGGGGGRGGGGRKNSSGSSKKRRA